MATLGKFPQEDDFRMVLNVVRAGSVTECLKSFFTSLKSGISGARIGFLPPGAKGSDGGDCPLGGRDGKCFHFFSFLLVLSWSLQKEGYKYQTILPYLVARAMCVGKRKSLPLPCPVTYVRLVQKESHQANTMRWG